MWWAADTAMAADDDVLIIDDRDQRSPIFAASVRLTSAPQR
jgi:hypothetical protein